MRDRPYRTGATWLTDDQLILLDVLFDGGASLRLLRRKSFLGQWAVGYVHDLDDASLECNVRWLVEHGVLEIRRDGDGTWFQMTRDGGELWSRERCPVWDRYCTEQYKGTLRGRTMMSVMAVSPAVRDQFLALWPPYPARRRTAVIADPPLLTWHPFRRLHVGIATYDERPDWSRDEYMVLVEQNLQRLATLKRERSWWGSIPELQRFVPKLAEPGNAADRGSI